MFMKRYSYKAGIVFGLSLAAFGGFMFFPPLWLARTVFTCACSSS